MDPRRPNAGSMDRTMSRPAGYDRRLEIWQNEAKMLKVFNGRRCWSRVEEMAERSLWTAADPMRGRMHRTTSRPAGYDRRHQIWQNEAKIVNVFNGRAVADVSGRVGVRGGVAERHLGRSRTHRLGQRDRIEGSDLAERSQNN
jgi:hypothetical protein